MDTRKEQWPTSLVGIGCDKNLAQSKRNIKS
jgi:hypothetical protein